MTNNLLSCECCYMRKIVIIILVGVSALFAGSSSLSAQEVDMMLYERDVNGVKIGTFMSKDQVIAIFGEPDYIHRDEPAEGIDKLFNQVNELYYYGESYLQFEDNIFIGFCLRDTSIRALANHVTGGISVGDSLTVFSDFKYGMPKKKNNKTYVLFYDSDNPVYLIVEGTVITGIDYSNPI